MGLTRQLALSTTPQNITVQTVCSTLIVKEDESVASWPTTGFIIKKSSAGDANFITAGRFYSFQAPSGSYWLPGMVLAQIYLPGGSTTAIQDET